MKSLINKLKQRGYKISTAESCTGGMIAKMITDTSGASEVFECGIVAYSNEMKMSLLGVKPETLDKFGAVSEETACEMASGILAKASADIAVSVTGVAGPDTSEGKPVGTVCIGIATKEKCYAATFLFAGKRGEIRRQSSRMALHMALDELGVIPKKKEKITQKAVSTVKNITKKITKK